ncbi:MAG: aminotransferase class V-fold PLP-dependent enzyme [Gemmatimonadaceae bacterium]
MSYDVLDLRLREFPWAARGEAIYLNNASTGPLPVRTVAAQSSFTALRAEPFRLSDELQFATIARSRELLAKLIGASSGEIALMVNTTYGINVAARALPLGKGDTVLTFDREFPSNIYPWMALAPLGVTLERIPCRDGLSDEEALLTALDKPGVRAVTVSWVSFATGYRADLATIGRACRDRGVYFIVDAMQGLGALTLDVRECFVDVLACGGQKWLLSPWGTGFIYVRSELVTALEPSSVGWLAMRGSDDFTRLVDYDFTYWDDARRFEVITLPFQDFAGLNASLELLLELGPKRVETHVSRLVDRAVQWSRERTNVRLITPWEPQRRAGIVAIAPADPQAVSDNLRQARVSHSLREGAIRLSPHCFNTDAEMERALQLLGGE